MNDKVTVTQFIKGPRAKIYQAWLKPELVVRWFSPENLKPISFRTDAKVGGSYMHVMSGPDGNTFTTVGQYLELVENEKLVFTWGKGDRGPQESVVTVELRDQDDGTLVTLTQVKLPADQISSHAQGWASALRNLQKYFKGDS